MTSESPFLFSVELEKRKALAEKKNKNSEKLFRKSRKESGMIKLPRGYGLARSKAGLLGKIIEIIRQIKK
ncbi:hypothetical protein D4Q76_02340 [archaeon]|nr:MAG: hypothetical protein D4Q76_02340 [archaeon]